MKNVTLETLLKGMSPFALAFMLSVSPASAKDTDAKADTAVEEGKDASKTEKKAKKAKKSNKAMQNEHAIKRGKKRKHHHASNPNGKSDDRGTETEEADVELANGEELEVRSPAEAAK